MFTKVYLNSDLLLTVIVNKLWHTVHIKDFETVFKLNFNSCECAFARSFATKTKIPLGTQYEIYSDGSLLAIFTITKDLFLNVFNLHWLIIYGPNLTTYFSNF